MKKPAITLILVTIILLLASSVSAQLHDRYVERWGQDVTPVGSVLPNVPNDCTDPSRPCRTINHAISQSGYGDIIKVAAGALFAQDVVIRPSSAASVKIEGGWNQDFTQRPIDINGYHFSYLGNGRFDIVAKGIPLDVTISGFKLTGGSAGNGGAISICSSNGGSATININNNRIEGNEASGYGGGIYAYNSFSTLDLSVEKNIIRNNTSGGNGGGVEVRSSPESTSTLWFTNNIIADNTSGHWGGGLFFFGGGTMRVNLTNNTITGNNATRGSGFVAESCWESSTLTVDIKNSIVWGNQGSEDILIYEVDTGGDSTATVNAAYSDIGDVHITRGGIGPGGTYNDNGGNINEDPLFVDPASGDYHLKFGSPTIDAGVCGKKVLFMPYLCSGPADDFEGDPRDDSEFLCTQWVGTNCSHGVNKGFDMGADEYNGASRSERDFNGDGRSDILWRHAADGRLSIWLMDGVNKQANGSPGRLADTRWQIKGVGDFDNDGKSDIVLRHSSSGWVHLILMNGLVQKSYAWPGQQQVGREIQGVGDFNGDGSPDILWRDATDGRLYIWLMDGVNKQAQGSPGRLSDLRWQIKGVGDFDNDGKSDIVLRHSSSGWVHLILMNGLVQKSYAWPGQQQVGREIQGVGDFNGDGSPDILWRDTADGRVSIWLMDGVSKQSEGSPATVSDTNWQIKGVDDYNGDGKSDILWRHASDGRNYIWLMDGTTWQSHGSPGTVSDTNWQIK